MKAYSNRGLLQYMCIIILGNISVSKNADNCDFETDVCGWKILESKYENKEISICVKDPTFCEIFSWRSTRWTRQKQEQLKHLPTFKGLQFPMEDLLLILLVMIDLYVNQQNNTILLTTAKPPSNRSEPESTMTSTLMSKALSIIHHPKCLQYFYLLHGNTELKVSYVPSDQEKCDSLPTEKFSLAEISNNNSHEKYLRKMSLDLPLIPQFKIVFQAVFLYGLDIQESYAVLDDIKISDGPCADFCTPFEFHCLQSDECIDINLLCDGIPHCRDGTDEDACVNNKIHCVQKFDDVTKRKIRLTTNINDYDDWLQNTTAQFHMFTSEERRGANISEEINDFPSRSTEKDSASEKSNIWNEFESNIGSDHQQFNGSLGEQNNELNIPEDDYNCNRTQACQIPENCSLSVGMCTLGFNNKRYIIEWRSLSCDYIELNEVIFHYIQSLMIIGSRIQSLVIRETIPTKLNYLYVNESIINNLHIFYRFKPFSMLKSIFLVNCHVGYYKEYSLRAEEYPIPKLSFNTSNVENVSMSLFFKGMHRGIYSKAFAKEAVLFFLFEYYNRSINFPVRQFRIIGLKSELLFTDFENNQIRKFPEMYSKYLYLKNNSIVNILDVSGTYELIDLSYNQITSIHQGDFRLHRRVALRYLNLRSNYIKYIDKYAFKWFPNLYYLDLSNNSIDLIRQNDLKDLKNLHFLLLNCNKIDFIHNGTFFNLTKLNTLNLSHNNIFILPANLFINLEMLQNLYLQNNKISTLQKDLFKDLRNLRDLNLSNNNIFYLYAGLFLDLRELLSLQIQNNKIISAEGMFSGLFSLKVLHVDFFSICCAKPRSIYEVQCIAPMNELSSCEQLISVFSLNICIWYVALFATFGNIFTIIYNVFSSRSKSSSYFILTCNLSFADLFMGIYLYIIAFVNMVYSGKYGFEDFHWRHSKLCIFAGVLATVSSEASALFVSLITFDRILAITRPFSNPHLVARRAILLSALAWIVSLVLALCPLFIPLEDFYAQTAICIYLPLSVKRQSGWEYSMVVFIGFNFILFLGILVGQIFILVEVIKSGRKIQSTNTKRREISLAKSVGAVVLTDLLCWIPIGIIAMMTFSGVDVSQEVYIWIIVLVLPINSALNPILYTLSALIRERNRQNQTPQRAEM